MTEATGAPPVMWGGGIVGFGAYEYRYASGRTGRTMAAGFSSRRQHLVVYVMDGFDDYRPLLDRLGPHTIGRSCLYLKRLTDIDTAVLGEIVETSYAHRNGTTIAD